MREAANPASRQFYESIETERTGDFDRSDQHLEAAILRRSPPIGLKRLIALGMGGVGSFRLVGVNSREVRQLVEDTISKCGEDWQSAWLRMRGLGDWADYLEEQLGLERSI